MGKKFLIKDLYVALIVEILSKKERLVDFLAYETDFKMLAKKYRFVNKSGLGYVKDCITDVKYRIYEEYPHSLKEGDFACYRKKLVNFFDFFKDFDLEILKKGKDPSKAKISAKTLIKWQETLNDYFVKDYIKTNSNSQEM